MHSTLFFFFTFIFHSHSTGYSLAIRSVSFSRIFFLIFPFLRLRGKKQTLSNANFIATLFSQFFFHHFSFTGSRALVNCFYLFRTSKPFCFPINSVAVVASFFIWLYLKHVRQVDRIELQVVAIVMRGRTFMHLFAL